MRVFRPLRLVGAAARMEASWRKAFRIARRAHIAMLAGFALAVMVIGAALAWLFEGPTNPALARLEDSAWWALNLISNVAYVDYHPLTRAGRLVAAVLEFTGIAFIGLFTASLAGALWPD